MESKKRKLTSSKTKADLVMIAATENFRIEKEKSYHNEQKKMRRPQVEKLTLLKETKKKAAPKPRAVKKSK
ncbi:MAG: hypothetical protein IPN13_09620 [Bacteroidetes bacterium]|nr:hypothetical protein [Bacteroidota bacterium]MBK7970214.1 hypothetical protein [Bacteroidota bacterium]MBK8874156.1 hypothetical protein [Bacteroidota bacterium]MBK9048381.1 hypothetical protein [Bacteroidota bacterium]MBK9425470.1 hypothetical protein [Bacteroidota bacterium]